MDKKDMERDFLNNLERVLEGKEIEPGLNDDSRSALDFARKMLSLRVNPSPLFHDTLRNRMLQKIEKKEREAEHEKGGSFWERLWENWKRPVWRTVTVGLVSALVIVVIMGYSGMFTYFTPQFLDEEPALPETAQAPAPEPAPVPEPGPAPLELQAPLEVIMSTEEDFYRAGEDVAIEFVFINTSDEEQTIRPFPPLVEITESGTGETVRSFPSGSTHRKLLPGEAVEYELNWDQLDSQGQPVLPGWFNVYAKEISITRGTSKRTIVMSGGGRLLISYPQGAMELDIALDQSQTVNGVTVALERAEFTEGGVNFYAFTSSLGRQQSSRVEPNAYPPPEPAPLEPVIAHAEYTYNGVTKDAGYAGFGFREDGIELSWMRLDPVPSDAGELTFTITKLGDYEGPWEFRISLE